MQNVPLFLQIIFILISCITVYWFYIASNKSKYFLIIAVLWMAIQMILGQTGFYTVDFTMPPRFLLLFLPAIVLTIIITNTKQGKLYCDSLNIKQLTLLHVIRVSLEITLYFLCAAKVVPEIMTFEGRNFDIVIGLSAPVIYYFSFVKKWFNRTILILWNIVAFVFALNIIILAVLSAKTPIQQFGFDQPNIAVAYFPFNWLPSVIVSILVFAHIVSLRQLFLKKEISGKVLSAGQK